MIEQVLKVLEKYGIIYTEDGYDTLPKQHCFAVWRAAHRKAEGSDGYAFYWRVTYELRLCYKERKTAEDKRLEKLIEEDFRALDELESDNVYDSKDNIDITIYTFTGKVEF